MAYNPNNPNGQATMANSAPVVVASDQSTIPVSLASVPSHAVTNAGTFAVQAAQSGVWTVTGAGGSFPVTDSGGSITVDAPVGTPVFVRLSDGASAISTLPVSLASVPSHAVTNAGTFVVQENGAALTALQLLDDVVVTDNAGFTDGGTKLSMSGFIYDEVAGTALTENDAAAARINVNRAQVHIIEDGTTRGRYAVVTASNALKVDGSAVTQPVSIAATVAVTQSGSWSLAANQSVNVAQMNGVAVSMGNGASGTGVQRVTIANDSTGILAGVATVTTVTTVTTLSGGGVAHDGADSGNPVKVGGQARTTNPTAVADADRANFITDKLGKQIVVGAIRELKVAQTTTISNTSETTVLSAGASGVFHDVYGVMIANTSATAVNVIFKDATSGTERFRIQVPAGDTRGFMLPVDSGYPQTSAANNWTATASASVSSLYITVFGVKNL